MSLPRDMVLSQGALQDYADCPRRFQLRYVLRVRWPANPGAAPGRDSRAEQGALFHQLVHQHLLGLSSPVLAARASAAGLTRWWQAYTATPPPSLPTAVQRPEVSLAVPLGSCRLVARFDLLAIDPGQRAVIVDWKTGEKRPTRAWLEERWQTLVYRYVLLEGGSALGLQRDFRADRVELVYWFADWPQQVERFPYHDQQHQTARARLLTAMDQISAHDEEVWPLTPDATRCRYCAYQTLCDRATATAAAEGPDLDPDEGFLDLTVDLEQVAEIEF